jgi:hypothetical protein
MILSSTTTVLQLKLGAATTTNPVEVLAAWTLLTTTTAVPEASTTTSNSTSDVTIVAAPSNASEQRVIKFISIFNADTVANTATIKHDTGGTERIIGKWNLNAGDSLIWSDGAGWYVMDSNGARKQASVLIAPLGSPTKFYGIDAANLTATKTITSASTFAYYMGQAETAYSSITLRYRVTTATATITWAEVGIASSPQVTIGGAASLTTRGWIDASGTSHLGVSTGIKTSAISVTGISAGMHLWAMFGNQATTAAVLRGALADDIQSGFFQAATARPSTMAAATAFAVEGATTVPVWGYWQGT